MSKVGGALPSWYWPAGVPRRVPVPQQPLHRLLRRHLPAAKDRPALVTAARTTTYGQLIEGALSAAGGIQAAEAGETIAVIEREPDRALLLLLAGMLAERRVLLADPGAPPQRLAAELQEAQAGCVLTACGAGAAENIAGVRVLAGGDLSAPFREGEAKPRRATDPVLLLPSPKGLVLHSHFSVAAMSTSLTAFIAALRQLPFLGACAPWRWEVLAGVFAALLHGMPVVFGALEDPELAAHEVLAQGGYTILGRDYADALIHAGSAPSILSRLKFVLVSTGRFTVRWRAQVESACGRPVLPVWGSAEAGPVVAAHPTWYPRQAHGFPLVNVSLVPVDPASGKISIVPWEMLES